MEVGLHILVAMVFSLPPALLGVMVVFLGPKLGRQRRIFFFLAACLTIGLISGLVLLAGSIPGLDKIEYHAAASLILMIALGIYYNFRYPEDRY